MEQNDDNVPVEKWETDSQEVGEEGFDKANPGNYNIQEIRTRSPQKVHDVQITEEHSLLKMDKKSSIITLDKQSSISEMINQGSLTRKKTGGRSTFKKQRDILIQEEEKRKKDEQDKLDEGEDKEEAEYIKA